MGQSAVRRVQAVSGFPTTAPFYVYNKYIFRHKAQTRAPKKIRSTLSERKKLCWMRNCNLKKGGFHYKKNKLGLVNPNKKNLSQFSTSPFKNQLNTLQLLFWPFFSIMHYFRDLRLFPGFWDTLYTITVDWGKFLWPNFVVCMIKTFRVMKKMFCNIIYKLGKLFYFLWLKKNFSFHRMIKSKYSCFTRRI